MKILVFDVREEEIAIFQEVTKELKTHVDIVTCAFSEETIMKCVGYDAISIAGMKSIDSEVLDKLKEYGIKYLSTRTIGYDHIDVKYANKIGVRVCNVEYPPESVADFTIMLILLVLRKYKQSLYRQNVNDYSLTGLKGKTIRSLTVGVIGTGKIGRTVMESLSGFGCKIIAYDIYQNPEVEKIATYVDLDTLYKQSDLITIHTMLSVDTAQMINEDTISKMKDGVILINTARGELMNLQALIKGIESKKIGGLGLDVFEEEKYIYHKSLVNDILSNRDMAYLRQFPNVVLTPHIAFYTNESVEAMVRGGIEGLIAMEKGSYVKELL
ncbi:D-isomer specific 2-hydroxyacid dehydrogenase family protein [Tannockella kyphosi]|uniref:D-isomer specific 2-hydroxyacid dehydrogenase family protein n=1 Tax=Tannockella kyphosi TaxID=2899121 RepID=UPI002010F1D4|nr:D-isomer specific 2-hydroxyacid dehydrogenase family protein [Tannockella kyphosi]